MSGGWGVVVAVALGLVISEFSELSPWLAQKLIHWAARVRYPTRVEELSALIAGRPGKLFKLVTASGFACAALTYRLTHRKTVPIHSLTSRFWIGFSSALVAGALLIGEILLTSVIIGEFPLSSATSWWARSRPSSRLPNSWPRLASRPDGPPRS
ncbi:MAG: hypothetical protein ACRDRA_02625 [Pseudonocardiaceae bacterium]